MHRSIGPGSAAARPTPPRQAPVAATAAAAAVPQSGRGAWCSAASYTVRQPGRQSATRPGSCVMSDVSPLQALHSPSRGASHVRHSMSRGASHVRHSLSRGASHVRHSLSRGASHVRQSVTGCVTRASQSVTGCVTRASPTVRHRPSHEPTQPASQSANR